MKESTENKRCMTPEEMLDFISGSFDGGKSAGFTLHISECAFCRNQLDGLQKVAEVIRRDDPVVHCDVTDAVMARIGADSEADSDGGAVIPFFIINKLLRVAAVFAVMSFLGVAIWRMAWTGPSADSELDVAVNDAAKWLVAVQNEDGAWDPAEWGGRRELGASLSGLAVLTILRSDVAADDSLARAEKHILSLQNEDGSFGPECPGKMYNHGIAFKALLALRSAGKGSAAGELDKAADYIVRSQTMSGGWSYRESDSLNSSIGVSVWQISALLAAHDAGMTGIDRSLRKGMFWLKGAYSGAGDFLYGQGTRPADMSDTVKAMGAMCMLSADKDILGSFGSDQIKALLAGAGGEAPGNDLYQSYFVSSAAAAGGEKDLLRRLKGFGSDIAGRRIAKGDNAGSWDAGGRWGNVGGRIYATSMAALSLSNMKTGGS